LTTQHCILSAKLTPPDSVFGDFAHWVELSSSCGYPVGIGRNAEENRGKFNLFSVKIEENQ